MKTEATTLRTRASELSLRDSTKRGTRHRIIAIKGAVSLGISLIMALHVSAGIAYGAETWLKKAFKKVVNVWRALLGGEEHIRIEFVEYTSHDDGGSYTLPSRFPDMPDGSRYKNKTVVITPEGVTTP